MATGNNTEDIVLVYDRQCPVCQMYCQMVRLRESVGQLTLMDARDGGRIVDEVTDLGWDIDQGMVLKLANQLYYGAEAMHALALISSRSGLFNRLNYWIFKSQSLSRFLYPILRSCRNLLLKILGRSKINNLAQPGNDRF